MLRAILNKSWRQHPTRHQLYGHLPPITKVIRVRQTRHAGHCWRSKDEIVSDVLLWNPKQKQNDQLEHTYSSYVKTQDVNLKTCQRRWMIGRSGERGSGISVLAARHDDDDDDDDSFRYLTFFYFFIMSMPHFSSQFYSAILALYTYSFNWTLQFYLMFLQTSFCCYVHGLILFLLDRRFVALVDFLSMWLNCIITISNSNSESASSWKITI